MAWYYCRSRRHISFFILVFFCMAPAMEQKSEITLNDLPPELIVLILTQFFYHLPDQPNTLQPRIKTLLHFGTTCKKFYNISSDSLFWQTIFALIDKQAKEEVPLYDTALSSLKTPSIIAALRAYAESSKKKESIEQEETPKLILTTLETDKITLDSLNKIYFLLFTNLLTIEQKQHLLNWSTNFIRKVTSTTWVNYRTRHLLHTLLCQDMDSYNNELAPSEAMQALYAHDMDRLKQTKSEMFLAVNNFQETLLIKAVRLKNYEATRYILENFFTQQDQVNRVDMLGMSALMCASYGCDQKGKFVELLLKHGANLNQQDQHNATPLFFAALSSNRPVINILLKDSADTAIKTSFGYTPLLVATLRGRYDIVEQLILANKDLINEPDDTKKTPLHHAAQWDNKQVATLLLKYGASITLKDITGKTPLAMAIKYNGLNTLELLFSSIILEEPDELGITPLMRAAIVGSLGATKFLLTHGANIHIKSSESERTALHHAAQGGHKPIVKILINAGANINVKSFTNFTPLMLAAERGFVRVVKFLLKKGAQVDLKNRVDDSALSLALANGHTHIVELLKKVESDLT